jgi:hypothetical protein
MAQSEEKYVTNGTLTPMVASFPDVGGNIIAKPAEVNSTQHIDVGSRSCRKQQAQKRSRQVEEERPPKRGKVEEVDSIKKIKSGMKAKSLGMAMTSQPHIS